MIADHIFYVTGDGKGVLLDAATGRDRRIVELETYNWVHKPNLRGLSGILPPTVSEGLLIVAVYGRGQQSRKAEGKVQAFHLASGKKAWEVEIPGAPGLMPGAPGLMPTLHGSHVLVGGAGRVMSIEASTGKQAWETVLEKGLGRNPPWLGSGFYEDGRLIVTWNKMRIALDADTGKELWRVKVSREGSPTLTGEGDRILHQELSLPTGVPILVALDATTGKPVWELKMWRERLPWAQNGAVLWAGNSALVNLDLKSGKAVWNYEPKKDLASPVLPGDGLVYLVQGKGRKSEIQAIDLATGILKWSHPLARPYERGYLLPDEKGIVYIGEGRVPIRVE